MHQVRRRLGAVLIACALIALVACDVAVPGFGPWWDRHAITTSIVSSLLIVGAWPGRSSITAEPGQPGHARDTGT